jgi:carboxymethylenebutenolidase
MGQTITLKATDGHSFSAYRADPAGTPKGAIVVIQEIFGVNSHIRNVTDRFAAEGYVAIAPAIFDRAQRNFETGYSPEEIAVARDFIGKIPVDAMLLDTQAAIDAVKDKGPIGIVGFCLGGSIAFLAAGKLNGLAAAVGYYGGMVAKNADVKPKAPVQLHFGEDDHGIPMSDVDAVKAKRPEIEVFTYKGAGHGFHCDERGSYNKDASATAWQRTTGFFAKHLKK